MVLVPTNNTRTVCHQKVKLIIHHQFSGIELISSVYACDSAKGHISSNRKVVTDSTMKTDFNINFTQGKPVVILIYELMNTKQFNKNVISSEDEARCIQLYIVWEVNNSKEFRIFSDMIEHDKGCVWDRDNLMKLARCCQLHSIQHVPIKMTYLMRDNTGSMTGVNVTRKAKCYKLEMTISETSVK
jgi:hypothetical protein